MCLDPHTLFPPLYRETSFLMYQSTNNVSSSYHSGSGRFAQVSKLCRWRQRVLGWMKLFWMHCLYMQGSLFPPRTRGWYDRHNTPHHHPWCIYWSGGMVLLVGREEGWEEKGLWGGGGRERTNGKGEREKQKERKRRGKMERLNNFKLMIMICVIVCFIFHLFSLFKRSSLYIALVNKQLQRSTLVGRHIFPVIYGYMRYVLVFVYENIVILPYNCVFNCVLLYQWSIVFEYLWCIYVLLLLEHELVSRWPWYHPSLHLRLYSLCTFPLSLSLPLSRSLLPSLSYPHNPQEPPTNRILDSKDQQQHLSIEQHLFAY